MKIGLGAVGVWCQGGIQKIVSSINQGYSRHVERALSDLGAERLPHADGRVLYEHLIGTRDILRAWNQPWWIEQAGLFHSVYSTDAYRLQLLSFNDRSKLQSIIGKRSERLVYLFCSISRKEFFSDLARHHGIPDDGFLVTQKISSSVFQLRITRQETEALVVMYMANLADQASSANGAPGIWLARVSAWGQYLYEKAGNVPPVFNGCGTVVTQAAEKIAREAYLSALSFMSNTADGAGIEIQRSLAHSPWVAEPYIWQSILKLASNDLNGCMMTLHDAKTRLREWNTSWDKRLTWDEWNHVVALIEQHALSGSKKNAGLTNDCYGDPRRLLNTLSGTSATSAVTNGSFTQATSPPEGAKATLSDARIRRYLATLAKNQSDTWMNHYPGLTSQAWYDPARFAIVQALEQAFPEIKREVEAFDENMFHSESEPIARKGSWEVVMLYERGRKNVENCSRCPTLTDIIETHETVRTLAGLIYASRMKPGTHVAPHIGPTNIRVRCHLGIHVPDGDCGLRVAQNRYRWRQGKCIVFDDSLEHEAWNHTEESRIVLIVDLWHPDLTAEELDFLKGLHRYASWQAESLNRYWAANSQSRALKNKNYD